jgi:outer membrane usher protein
MAPPAKPDDTLRFFRGALTVLLSRRQLALAIGVGLVSACGLGAGASHASPLGPGGEVNFDLKQLAGAGFSAEVAQFFSHEVRFLPGVHMVGVSVNAGTRQDRQVRFDAEGRPCFDASLLTQLGMTSPTDAEGEACVDMAGAFPGWRVELRPGQSQMDLTVPQSAFVSGVGDGYQRGGTAALLNYDLFASRYQSRFSDRGYLNARLEAGINADNWAVRSRGSYSHDGERSRYVQQETYAQRPIERLSALLQVGQLSTMSDGFGGLPILGAQLYSDAAQGANERLPVPIQGIADTHAVVEVRQRGQVVYRTVVAPGPYTISDVGAVTRGTDIEVVVTEEDGRSSRFVVPAPLAASQRPQPATFRVGAGKYRPLRGQVLVGPAPWVAYGDYAFNVIDAMRLSSSALLAQRYQGASAQTTFAAGERTWWGFGARVSRTPGHGLGHEWQVQGNASLGAGLYGGLSWQSRSRGFRLLEDTLLFRQQPEDYVASFQRSLSASLGWSHARWGSIAYGLSRTKSEAGDATSHTLTASRRFGNVSANLSLQKAEGRGLAAFLNLQIPLGRDSVNARAYRYENGQQSVGAAYMGRLTPDVSYQVEAMHSDASRRLGASMQARTAYASLSGGVSQIDSHTRSFYGSASGGMALTGDGLFAMSSSRVSDTFAVVKIPSVSGIRMNATGGSAKTSVFGTALVPSIYPYRNARIQLDGKSLPFNYRFDTTAIDLKVARGTVSTHVIGARELRQLMLTVRTADGRPARVGSSIFNGDGDFMGTVVGEGNIVLDNEEIGQPVYMDHHGTRCEIRYDVPTRFDPERPYEEAEATCA